MSLSWITMHSIAIFHPSFLWDFSNLFCPPPPPPQLREHKFFMTPGARAIFLHSNVLYNNLQFVTGGHKKHCWRETKYIRFFIIRVCMFLIWTMTFELRSLILCLIIFCSLCPLFVFVNWCWLTNWCNAYFRVNKFSLGSFPFVLPPPPPPPPVRYAAPVTEHVPLHIKSLGKNMARASGGCK